MKAMMTSSNFRARGKPTFLLGQYIFTHRKQSSNNRDINYFHDCAISRFRKMLLGVDQVSAFYLVQFDPNGIDIESLV